MQLKFENHFGRQSGRSLNILNVEYFSVQLKTVIIKKKLKKKKYLWYMQESEGKCNYLQGFVIT